MNVGTNPLGVAEFYEDYYPATYSLTVEPFNIDKTEVTKAHWDEVYNWAVTNGYGFDNSGLGKASNHPVHTVNWYDCVKWCNARSQISGRTPCYTVSGNVYKTGQSSPDCDFDADGYRLPTNDEWEYAARGGLSSKRFPWGDTVTHNQANYYSSTSYSYDISLTRGSHPDYDDGGYPYTSPVGSFASNGYGLYDMAGNLWEWCNTQSGSGRCVRGGSWGSGANGLRCGGEVWYGPDGSYYGIGFRAVCR
jgi:formylglycine-generating enzyme required for sulfatase activity